MTSRGQLGSLGWHLEIPRNQRPDERALTRKTDPVTPNDFSLHYDKHNSAMGRASGDWGYRPNVLMIEIIISATCIHERYIPYSMSENLGKKASHDKIRKYRGDCMTQHIGTHSR